MLSLQLVTGALIVAALAGLPSFAHAQAVRGPGASSLWSSRAVERPALPAAGIDRQPSAKERGLLKGAVIGALAAGFLGNRVCRENAATGGCTGQTLWWGALGGMLGGIIGATAAGDHPARSESTSENTSPTRRGGA